MGFFHLRDIDVRNKRVLVRTGFDVPLLSGKIEDDRRIREGLPTIRHLLSRKCKVILIGHMGRPGGRRVEEFRYDPVAKRLSQLLGRKVAKLDDCVGPKVARKLKLQKPGQIILLENLRFHKEEQSTTTGERRRFGKALASYADVYVNECFSDSHHDDTSITEVPAHILSCSGFQLDAELEHLGKAAKPKRPFVAIVGGKKAEKIATLEKLLKRADAVIVSGLMANTFLKAMGIDIQTSLYSEEMLSQARKLCRHKKVILPFDCVYINGKVKQCAISQLPKGASIMDIGMGTLASYKRILRLARTVFWAGPVGKFEDKRFARGTKEIAFCIARSNAISIVGGGDTSAAVDQFGVARRFTHISSGGGASLAVVEGKKLPGIAALEESYRKFKKAP